MEWNGARVVSNGEFCTWFQVKLELRASDTIQLLMRAIVESGRLVTTLQPSFHFLIIFWTAFEWQDIWAAGCYVRMQAPTFRLVVFTGQDSNTALNVGKFFDINVSWIRTLQER